MRQTEVRTYFENGPFVDMNALYIPVRKAQRMETLAARLGDRAFHRSFAEQNFRAMMTAHAAQRTADAYTQYLRDTHGVTIATITYHSNHSEGQGSFEVIDNGWAFNA